MLPTAASTADVATKPAAAIATVEMYILKGFTDGATKMKEEGYSQYESS